MQDPPSAGSFSVGVDLGGTSVRVAALTETGTRLYSHGFPTRVVDGPDAVVADISQAVRVALARAGDGLSLRGIGLGSPGPLTLPEGRLLHLPNFPGFDGFALRQSLESVLGMPVIVESDANAAALAEWRRGAGTAFGRGSEADSLCMLTLGTGVGNGIILDGRVWHGMNGMGGEAGHVPILPDGVACGCGGSGCLEMYASATAMRRMALERADAGCAGLATLAQQKPGFMARDVALLAEAGDADARQLFADLGRYIGLGLAGLINTLNLPLYVVGGGLASAWPLFAEEMFRTVQHYSYVYRLSQPRDRRIAEPGKTNIVPATLGPDAGIIGAAMLPYLDR